MKKQKEILKINRRKFLSSLSSVMIVGSMIENVNGSQIVQTNNGFVNEFKEIPQGFIYLNSGTEGSMQQDVLKNYIQNLHKWAANPTTSYETDPVLGKHQHLNREQVAKFLNVEKNNICLTDNTTMGLSMTLMGLKFNPGDKVVITNQEHTAINSPLEILTERNGIKVVETTFPETKKLSKINSKSLIDALFPVNDQFEGAKALCVSHVYPTTGVRLPLKDLRNRVNELGIEYLIVDGAQAMGMIDVSMGDNHISHCDFYACPGHKWLNAPPGTGILYIKNSKIRPPEFYPTLSQRMGKYSDGNKNSSFPMVEALQVRGCSNACGFTAMTEAFRFVDNVGGPAAVEKYILFLSHKFRSFLDKKATNSIISPINDQVLSSGITSFFPFSWNNPTKIFKDRKTAEFVVSHLLKKNIQIRYIGFKDGESKDEVFALRVSTALFNDISQIEALQKELELAFKSIN